MTIFIIVSILIFVVVIPLVVFYLLRIKKCPSDKILVIYGVLGKNPDGTTKTFKCIHGGFCFVWPIFQSYTYLDLTPIQILVNLKNALSKNNVKINVDAKFTVGISVENGVMQNAVERLLCLKSLEIQELAKDIIFGQLRLVIATMNIEEINNDRDIFLGIISRNIEIELKKIGLRLININLEDISDNNGYFEALAQAAVDSAINDSRKKTSEKYSLDKNLDIEQKKENANKSIFDDYNPLK